MRAAPAAAQTAAAGSEAESAAAAPADGAEDDGFYRIQPGDVISVQVLEDSSLNRDILVQPDGRISFPLAGVVMAGGLTPEELQAALSDALSSDFLAPPTITVSLKSSPAFDAAVERIRPTFYVLGQVAQPGQFEILKPVSILQALAIAGGPSVFAATDRIQLRRVDEEGGESISLFDFEAVEDGLPSTELYQIADGDVIYVPEAGLFE